MARRLPRVHISKSYIIKIKFHRKQPHFSKTTDEFMTVATLIYTGQIHYQLTRRWEYLASLSLTLSMWILYVPLYVLYTCVCICVCVWTLTNDGDSELTYRRRPWVRAKRSSCPGSWRVGCRQPSCAVGRPHGLTAGDQASGRVPSFWEMCCILECMG